MVVAHGSRADAANAAHRATVAELRRRLDVTVVAAFLELAEPDIAAAIDEVIAAGATDVGVLPYLLYPGRHVVDDIPEIVAAAGRRHADVAIRLLPAFGADPAVLDVLVAQAGAAVGRGPGGHSTSV